MLLTFSPEPVTQIVQDMEDLIMRYKNEDESFNSTGLHEYTYDEDKSDNSTRTSTPNLTFKGSFANSGMY